MEIRSIAKSELWGHLEPHAGTPAIAILFGGDRLSCCDEVLAAYDGDQFLAAVSVSSEGEMLSGEPTIVGMWVHYAHRRQGVGKALLEAAIGRMIERGLTPIRLDVMSTKVGKIIEQLPEDLRGVLKVCQSGTCDPLLDA